MHSLTLEIFVRSTYRIHVSLFEKYLRQLLMSPFASDPNTVCTVMRLKKGSRQTYWALKSPPHQIIKWKAKPTLTLQSLTYLILRIRQEMMIKRIFWFGDSLECSSGRLLLHLLPFFLFCGQNSNWSFPCLKNSNYVSDAHINYLQPIQQKFREINFRLSSKNFLHGKKGQGFVVTMQDKNVVSNCTKMLDFEFWSGSWSKQCSQLCLYPTKLEKLITLLYEKEMQEFLSKKKAIHSCSSLQVIFLKRLV